MPHDLTLDQILPPPVRPSPLLLDFPAWHATAYAGAKLEQLAAHINALLDSA